MLTRNSIVKISDIIKTTLVLNAQRISTKYIGCISLCFILASCQTPPQVINVESTTTVKVNTTQALNNFDQIQYDDSVHSINQGEFEQAEKILRDLSKNHPNHSDIWLNLAISYLKQDKIKLSVSALEQSINLDSTNAEAYNLSGLLAVENKQFKVAETQYIHAMNLDNRHANAHYNLALLYDIYYQEISKAYLYYQKYLNLTPVEDKETREWVEQLQYSIEQP